MRILIELSLISPYLFAKMFVQVNTLQAIKEYFHKELTSIYSKDEAQIFFEITCEHFMGWNKMQQKMKSDARLSESEMLDFHFTLKRLRKKEPIQYILEEAPFYGMNFKVSPATLIPRPETEELVDLIIKNIDSNSFVLDIGTGSGCIPIAIKKNLPETKVFATDVSDEALRVAKENASQIDVNITFEEHDILSQNDLPNTFPSVVDVIVSNPPYVRKLEKMEMEKSVVDHEPHLALFVEDEDPLIFYKAIGLLGRKILSEEGKLYFEINQYLAKETKRLIEDMGYSNVRLIKDINNNDRILYAEK